ncbi:MAG: hypothetical protein ACKO24_19800 [Leptolyngbyaceae cyanobacterium]
MFPEAESSQELTSTTPEASPIASSFAHHGATLEENLHHLRERLRYLTVVDRERQVVGVVDDLIISADHRLKLVIAETAPSHRSVLLDSKHILKASARKQTVYLDLWQSDLVDLIEVITNHEIDQIWPEQPATSATTSMTVALSSPPQQESPVVDEPIPAYSSLAEIATEEQFQSPQPTSEVDRAVPELAELSLADWQPPVIAPEPGQQAAKPWPTIAPEPATANLEGINLLSLIETGSTAPTYASSGVEATETDSNTAKTQEAEPALDLSDLFVELPPLTMPAMAEIDPMAGWEGLNATTLGDLETAPFISEAELLELFPVDEPFQGEPALEPEAPPLTATEPEEIDLQENKPQPTTQQKTFTVQASFTDPVAASRLLKEIVEMADHRCQTIHIVIEVTDPELQARYQEWLEPI